ncbi:MAG: hypothetical protein EZS28_001161 [Streblomastix strix]|uniref:Uncharacterized protein n=1 Tax=Streblomastix strix TaxID=222440 RepID=A0A5J4X9P4_9EUKA|nr:MAG: hypothetical protein EZS28_001161 [Streblomastix strix]
MFKSQHGIDRFLSPSAGKCIMQHVNRIFALLLFGLMPPYSHLPLVQTVGQNYKEIKTKYKELQIFDIGGSQQLRVLWPDYVISADSIFFVIDGGAKDRFEEASSELKKLLPTISQRHIPLIIIANKCDTIAFETMETIISVFKPLLNDLKNSSIFRVSAFTGEGVVECLNKIVLQESNQKGI